MNNTFSLSKWAFSFFILLLFLSLNRVKTPTPAVYSSETTKEKDMVIFKEIVTKCQQFLPKNENFEGILILEIDLDESNKENIDDALLWSCILVTSINNNFKHYKFTKRNKKKVTYEESEMPFGYTSFSSIDFELKTALDLIQKDQKSTCKNSRLYFPLSPFDTEPLWLFTFENGKKIFVGANTGKIELAE